MSDRRRRERERLVGELTRIKASGIARVGARNCPLLLSIAQADDTGARTPADPYAALLGLLHAVLSSWTAEPGVADATRVLLGLEHDLRFVTLAAGRRLRAAELVGYSVSTMARRKESEYLVRLADAILDRAPPSGVGGPVRLPSREPDHAGCRH